MYAKFFKRFFDFILSLFALVVLSPLLVILTVLGAIMMKGNPFFTQDRPGYKEKIFKLIKFRTMTCEKDANGELLPDDRRLNGYGKLLRSTSLDELPELINILKGDMAIVGPRPLLVRDMTFMTKQQRMRHNVYPGLTGLAQINGRNDMTWEQKLDFDRQYIDEGITLRNDVRILVKTVITVIRRDGINEDGSATATDFGDYLLQKGAVTKEEYDEKQYEAKQLLR